MELKKYQEAFEDESLSLIKVQNIKNLKDAAPILFEIVEQNPFIQPNAEKVENNTDKQQTEILNFFKTGLINLFEKKITKSGLITIMNQQINKLIIN